MAVPKLVAEPRHSSYDVVVIGGAMIGSSVAWFLSTNEDFSGRVLVVERDPSYEFCSTAATGSCIRHQFSNAVNVQISMFGTQFIRNFRNELGGDPEVPAIDLEEFGYLFLSREGTAQILRENQAVQSACGAATRLLAPDEIAEQYPFFNLDEIVLGSHNPVGEGRFDGNTMMQHWRRQARENGVEYITNEVVAIGRTANQVESVTLLSGEKLACGAIVNASGPRAARTARFAGIDVPVEPRKRSTFVFDAQNPLEKTLPLTIDPDGIYCVQDGKYYRTATTPPEDPAVDYDDFEVNHAEFEEIIWPTLAHRIPVFEAIKVVSAWAGHYAYNTLDHNAVVGPHHQVSNFIFANGFSGHGLQQSPAMGRGVSELVTYGEYRTLDLSPLGYDRIVSGTPFLEKAII